jgi:hypothetical protein
MSAGLGSTPQLGERTRAMSASPEEWQVRRPASPADLPVSPVKEEDAPKQDDGVGEADALEPQDVPSTRSFDKAASAQPTLAQWEGEKAEGDAISEALGMLFASSGGAA